MFVLLLNLWKQYPSPLNGTRGWNIGAFYWGRHYKVISVTGPSLSPLQEENLSTVTALDGITLTRPRRETSHPHYPPHPNSNLNSHTQSPISDNSRETYETLLNNFSDNLNSVYLNKVGSGVSPRANSISTRL